MFLYELSNRINPDMKKETTHRFSSVWLSMLMIRKQLNAEKLIPFSDEAKRIYLKDSYSWIHYNELKMTERLILCIRALFKSRTNIVRGVLSRVFHIQRI